MLVLRAKRRGFALVEALVAFLLLFIAIVVAFSVFAQVYKGLQLSENHLHAAVVGHGLLNQVRSQEYATIAAGTGRINYQGLKNGLTYTQQMLYTLDVRAVDADRRRVILTVQWGDAGGTKQVVLETLVTNL